MSSHIAICLQSLQGGGAEKMMLRIADELSRRGHRVDLLIIHKEGEYESRIPESVDVFSLSSSQSLTSVPEVVQYIRKNNPDSMLSTLTSPNLVSIWSSYVTTGTKTVIRVANDRSVADTDSTRQRVYSTLRKLTYPHADQVIAISGGVERYLLDTLGVPPDRTNVIHNPAYSEEILKLRTKPVSHNWLDGDETVVIGVGRLTPQKDFKTLLRAFAQVLKTRDAKLIILGKGEERENLQKLAVELNIASDVSMPGFVDNPYAYMYRSDLFALSSRYEGFGNVIVEAMACETPVVATDCPGGPSEILNNGKYGKLVPTCSPTAFRHAINNALESSIPTGKLLERAQDFSTEQIVEKYEKILTSNKQIL